MNPIDLNEIPTDSEIIASEFEVIACEDGVDLANVALIVGQLDALEVVDGKPRWTEDQRLIIVKTNQALREWKE